MFSEPWGSSQERSSHCAMKTYQLAVIPGDGIGKEVVPEGLRVLQAVGSTFGIGFEWTHFDWSCETYKATGRMMPEDGLARLRDHDAIFLGALASPAFPTTSRFGVC